MNAAKKWGRSPIYLFLRQPDFSITNHGSAAKIGKSGYDPIFLPKYEAS
jgi:hypothetical protein